MLRTKALLVFGGCMLAAGCHRAPQARPPATASPVAAAPPPVHATVTLPGGATIADVAAKVTPSVVNVFSERTVAVPELSPYHSDPFFHFFFDVPEDVPLRREPQRERSLGSGVIVSSDGVILTNNHVVDHADKVRVALQDGRELDAKVVGTDPPSDVAVLRVKAKDLPAIEIADSSKTRVGDLVLAIGNPFGLGQTVTMGIISATGRANMGITDYEDFIQTDAAINPGNSGGALVDMQGKLVGINTAIVSRSGGYQGVGFAIPSNMAVQVKDVILGHGKVTRGWLGVAVQNVTDDLARSMDLQPHRGVLVSDVTPGSPAARAGIARGDVILAIDGHATNTSTQLRNAVALAGKGAHVRVDVAHERHDRTIDVVLGEVPDATAIQAVKDGVLSGLAIAPLDAAGRRRYHVPDGVLGVLVSNVERGSAAAEIGLRAGDVIVEVNRKETPDLEAFRNATRAEQDSVLLLVYRDGATIYMSLTR
jgi:serine protease Do